MKEKLSDPRLPRKRSRSNIKEDDSKKKPVTPEELEKIKKLDAFIDQIIHTIDPFTVDPFDFTTPNIKDKFPEIRHDLGNQDLYREYIQEPQKQKKKFAECKKRFDLIMNKEDPEQESLMGLRFEIYNKSVPVNGEVQDMLGFLGNLQIPKSAIERKLLQKQALLYKNKTNDEAKSACTDKKIALKILEIDPPPSANLSTQEKLALLRGMTKHIGDWEKIAKEFKSKPVETVEINSTANLKKPLGNVDLQPVQVDILKKIWRCLKVTMKEEVLDIRKKVPQYHFFKWLRAAIRKLEQSNGKKHRPKSMNCVNPKPKEHRFDMLNLMIEAENTKRIGIESSTHLIITSSSSFKAYVNPGTLKELCN